MTKSDLLDLARPLSGSSFRQTIAHELAQKSISRDGARARRTALKAKVAHIDRVRGWVIAATYPLIGGMFVAYLRGHFGGLLTGLALAVAPAVAWLLCCAILERAKTSVISWCMVIPGTVLILPLTPLDSPIAERAAVLAMVSLVWLMGAFFVAQLAGVVSGALMNAAATSTELDLLSPIAGTQRCITMVKFLEAGDAVKKWRDLAVAEREELLEFDWEIAQVVAQSEIRRSARGDAQAALEAACRTAHGVA